MSLLKILRKHRPPFDIGEELLAKMRGPDRGLYLDIKRPYPPIFERPQHPEGLETRKKIEKHINELLEMDVIWKNGNNDNVEVTTPVLITCHDRQSRF
ncbi:hypothetical protein O181_087514 [Austropuccinia psidii MF-1]|uniref:Uncharacterized protein n=1 Tax=Austropuccinia psidii MF-1 TaxID=1389203 RepID=A0A9Q3IPW0_9BASI|nr:hypothetical protein [Austropuccinia psidii MF-1]